MHTIMDNNKSKQYIEAFDQYSIISKTDRKGNITYANEKFSEISGYSNQELIGNPISMINSGYHSKEFWKTLWRTISIGDSWHGTIRNETKNGAYYWVQTGIYPIVDGDNNIDAFFAIRTDITSSVEKQCQINQTQTKLRAFFESSTDINILLDKNMRVSAFNKVAENVVLKYFGHQLKEGERILDFTSIGKKEDFQAIFDDALNGKSIHKITDFEFHTGRKRCYFDFKYNPARDLEGKIIGVAFNAIDVTSKVEAENELKNRARIIDDISLMSSHGVRGPVARILGLVNLIEFQKLDDYNQDLFDKLNHSTLELDAIIKDVVNRSYHMIDQ